MHLLHLVEYIAVAVMIVLLLLVLFEPPLRYTVKAPGAALDSEDFLRVVAALADAPLYRGPAVEPLIDGKCFYEAELAAIAQASRSVHLEAFIFHPSAIGDRFLAALVDRAKNGVKVRVVLDTIGSFPAPQRYFDPLRLAGGEVRWYQPLGFGTLKRLNNRTHRELIIIDGRIGFIGGAGIASHWDIGEKGKPPWRDMMFRVEGALVNSLQSTFAENWLESSNEILSDVDAFPAPVPEVNPGEVIAPAATAGLVITSSPTSGRSTRNRVLFQLLIASAARTICIHSPYFLPDRSASGELVRAVRERGVRVQVIVPGDLNNHPLTRLASRRRYGPLLEAGVEIHEYQPGMIHTKMMTVDGIWVIVGSTNFDSRSFDLNDEVNLAVVDARLAARLQEEFSDALSKSRQVVYEAWKRRSIGERIAAQLGRLWERQE